VIHKRIVSKAVAEMLATVTGMPVGRGQKPQGEPPYYLLYSLDTSVDGAPFPDLKEDASLVYQVTSVSGPSSSVISSAGFLDQAEWMADAARDAFLLRHPATGLWLHALDIPGHRDICRELETEPGGTSDPADAIISYVQRFRIDLSPA
jgi:hypothetical protein